MHQSGLSLRGTGRAKRCRRRGKSPLLVRRAHEKNIHVTGADVSRFSPPGRNAQGHRAEGIDGARLPLWLLVWERLAIIADGPRPIAEYLRRPRVLSGFVDARAWRLSDCGPVAKSVRSPVGRIALCRIADRHGNYSVIWPAASVQETAAPRFRLAGNSFTGRENCFDCKMQDGTE